MTKTIRNKSAAAKRLGVSRSTLYALLNVEKTTSVEVAVRLARELGGSARDWYRRPRTRGRPPSYVVVQMF
ncbi:MAG: helix-turn-helix domain-containing protein [Rhizobiales bacterium]|nr:helix-turn-helix domain-containing protein [Hyphomicrobiales bacterium]